MKTDARQPRRQGIAMVMVLTVIAAAGILAYAMLATAATRTKIADASVNRVQRQYLAESGVNLGVYYLRNPSKSPVSLVAGASGNSHYPGETAIQIGDIPGTLTVAVTNTGNNKFLIVSTATHEGESMTSRAVIKVERSKTFSHAANLAGAVTLNSKVKIEGGLITDGALVSNSANLAGSIAASNGASFGGTNSTTTEVTTAPSMTAQMPYYYVNGTRYTAKKLTSTVATATLLDADTVNNPYNVWYNDVNTRFSSTTTINGSIILTGTAQLQISGSLDVRPAADMIGLSVSGNVNIMTGANTLWVRGPTFVGGQIVASTASTTPMVRVEGAFISGRTGWPFASTYKGNVELKLDSTRATIKGFAEDLEEVTAVRAQSWELDNGRPL